MMLRMMNDAAATTHFLLSASSVWGDEYRVLGIYASERDVLEVTWCEDTAADDGVPVRLRLEQWRDGDRLSVLTASLLFALGTDAAFSWTASEDEPA